MMVLGTIKNIRWRYQMNGASDYDYKRQRVRLLRISEIIADFVADKDRQYGSSWRKRGGPGAFFTIARKWDRIEEACASEVFGQDKRLEGEDARQYDLFDRFAVDSREEGINDDVVDLIGYLLVLLEYMVETGRITKICGINTDADHLLVNEERLVPRRGTGYVTDPTIWKEDPFPSDTERD